MRKCLIITPIIVVILGSYLGFTFYSRRRDNRRLVQRIEERRRSQQPRILDAYRGKELKIVFFYASPGTIARHKKAQLCYGVINSEKIRIEPPVKYAFPALSNCVDVAPKSTTAYKLIAEDVKGNRKEAEATVEVF